MLLFPIGVASSKQDIALSTSESSNLKRTSCSESSFDLSGLVPSFRYKRNGCRIGSLDCAEMISCFPVSREVEDIFMTWVGSKERHMVDTRAGVSTLASQMAFTTSFGML